VKAGDLKKWEKNPRKMSASKERILGKTIDAFGDLSGIVYNRRNKQLGGGHMRTIFVSGEIVITATHNKPTAKGTVAVGYVEHDGEQWAYREVDWDEQTHAAAAIAANKGGGEWDYAVLNPLFIELDDGAFDIELTGHDLIEVENMLSKVGQEPEPAEKAEPKEKFASITTCPNCGVMIDG